MILNFAHYRNRTRSSMQGIPDFQQNTVAIFCPLMIPETQFFNSLCGKKLFTFNIVLMLPWQPMMKAVQFD